VAMALSSLSASKNTSKNQKENVFGKILKRQNFDKHVTAIVLEACSQGNIYGSL